MEITEILNEEFCDTLVRTASSAIRHNVLLTDGRGIIVANANNTRIGQLHEASVRVLRWGRTEYHGQSEASRLTGTLPGVTIPILIDRQVIGTLGITGMPEEISRYAVLIQQMAQIFLSFQNRQQSATELERKKKELIREVLSFNCLTSDSAELRAVAYSLGVNLDIARACVIVRLDLEKAYLSQQGVLDALTQAFSSLQDIVCAQREGSYLVLTALDGHSCGDPLAVLAETCRTLAAHLGGVGNIKFGIGTVSASMEQLRQSYENARLALQVAEARGPGEPVCLTAADVALERLASAMPEAACEAAMEDYFQAVWQDDKRREETIRLVECWVEQQFNLTLSARVLHIHRSTLMYRFQRMRDLYGLDPYNTSQILAFYLLTLKRRFS